LAKQTKLRAQIGFLDEGRGPGPPDKFGLGNDPTRRLRKRRQDVECPSAHRHGGSSPQEHPGVEHDLEVPEGDPARGLRPVAGRRRSRLVEVYGVRVTSVFGHRDFELLQILVL
jgi:hypothetical protein